MEPIVKLTQATKVSYEWDKFFYSDNDAKRYAEKLQGKKLDWEPRGDYAWNAVDGEYGYHISPVDITVLDEEDGEI